MKNKYYNNIHHQPGLREKHRQFSCLLFLLYAFGMIFISGCGYQFASGVLPAGIKSLCITMLENQTCEIGAEVSMTNALIDEFTRNTDVILSEPSKADAVLSGEIVSVNIETVSRKGANTSVERRIRLNVRLKLTDAADKILWKQNRLSVSETYVVTSDKILTEQNRQYAVSEIAKQMAESVYYQMTSQK